MQPLEKVRPVVEQKLRAEKVDPMFQEVGAKLQELADKYTGLRQLAAESSTTVEVTGKLDRSATFYP